MLLFFALLGVNLAPSGNSSWSHWVGGQLVGEVVGKSRPCNSSISYLIGNFRGVDPWLRHRHSSTYQQSNIIFCPQPEPTGGAAIHCTQIMLGHEFLAHRPSPWPSTLPPQCIQICGSSVWYHVLWVCIMPWLKRMKGNSRKTRYPPNTFCPSVRVSQVCTVHHIWILNFNPIGPGGFEPHV